MSMQDLTLQSNCGASNWNYIQESRKIQVQFSSTWSPRYYCSNICLGSDCTGSRLFSSMVLMQNNQSLFPTSVFSAPSELCLTLKRINSRQKKMFCVLLSSDLIKTCLFVRLETGVCNPVTFHFYVRLCPILKISCYNDSCNKHVPHRML